MLRWGCSANGLAKDIVRRLPLTTNSSLALSGPHTKREFELYKHLWGENMALGRCFRRLLDHTGDYFLT